MPNSSPFDASTLDAPQFWKATEHSPIGTALVGLDGAWLKVNAALRNFLGYEAEELAQLTFQDLTHPEDLDADMEQFQQLLDGAVSSYQMDKRYFRKDGVCVWAELTVSLVRDSSGAPLFFISHVQDIGARKAAEIEQARLTERITMATRGAGIGIWEWEFSTGLLVWSPEMFDLFGKVHRDGAVRLEEFLDAVLEEDKPGLGAEVEAAKGGQVMDTEFRIRRDDGAIRSIKAFGSVHYDAEGRPVRMIGANWDVTALRALADRAEAANRAKSQFLAVMSHEIRTPMNGILGMTQAMMAQVLTTSQRRQMGVIAESGEALMTILNDILDLSKVEAGRLELECVDFDLERLLQSVCATYAPIADEKGLSIVLDLAEARGVYRGDPTRLRQILSNLMSNSLKFTERGHARITARREGAGLVIEVSDTGQGMDKAVLQRIFRPFTQADASTTRNFGGTGLGLSIVRELAQLMGGEIAVDSRPGQGARFSLSLPMPYIGAAEIEAAASAGGPGAQLAPLRVLAAEDNAINQLVLRTLLGPLGVDPVIVSNGAEAVEAWQGGEWDLVLMDVQMPIMDGFAATDAIRAIEAREGRAPIPIIALTANAMSHHRAECLAHGMNALVPKPIEIRGLAAAMEEACRPRPPAVAA